MYSTTVEGEKLSSSTSTHPCHRFSLAEIQSTTKDFDDELVIGEGGFGKVYKGQISIEEADYIVAIKRLDSMSDQGATEFRAEIEMLSKLRHCNLVSLIGYCDDNQEMILVYKYMLNGTLYHHLHKSDTHLNWVQRMKIALGAARGLDYLHTGVGSKHGIIHRDVKTSNILMDENWTAMISDFGLSKIGPTNQSVSYIDASVKGTFGYLDPEYFYTRRLTRKTDVFAFGVVLFELLSGRLPVDIQHGEEECSLVRWAQKCVKKRKLDQMVDPNMRGTIISKCLRLFAEIAYRCLISVPKERPTMTEVVASLLAIEELQVKYVSSANSLETMGFTWKIHKLFVSTTKQNSDQRDTSSLKSLEKSMNQSSSSTNMDGSDRGEITRQHGELESGDVKLFTYTELKLATRSFGNDTFLGSGTDGKVYKGWVDNTTYSPCENNTGLPIVVKKLHRYKLFNPEMLKEFSHPNLVKLIGYCLENKQLLLVYEFMLNGNLEDRLHSGSVARIPWEKKVKIAVGIARGIVFLHNTQGNNASKYSHWDEHINMYWLYRHKIFLDEDFTAKLSDYDITKFVHGYYRGCYETANSYLNKTEYFYPEDVILAEVLTGKKISNKMRLYKIDDMCSRLGRRSLTAIAATCFQICNEVDSESRMLTILKGYEKYIPEMTKYDSYYTAGLERCYEKYLSLVDSYYEVVKDYSKEENTPGAMGCDGVGAQESRDSETSCEGISEKASVGTKERHVRQDVRIEFQDDEEPERKQLIMEAMDDAEAMQAEDKDGDFVFIED